MRAAFFDVDGTLTATRVWQGVIKYFTKNRLRRGTQVIYALYHYPLFALLFLKLIDEGNFRALWSAHMGWFIKGYTLNEVDEIWDWVVKRYVKPNFRNDTVALLNEHIHKGDFVALVSGGPLPLLQRIAKELGVEHTIGTSFEIVGGVYTGKVDGEVCLVENKAIFSKAYINTLGLDLDLEESTVYADSVTDIPLLEMVGTPVATYPDKKLRSLAIDRGWKIFPK